MEENKSNQKQKRFKANNTYLSICVYAVITFTVCLIIFKFINNWHDARKYLLVAMSTLSPFLIAFLIVYFISPLVNTIDHLLFSNFKSKHFPNLHKYISLCLAYIIFLGAIALIMTFMIPQVVDSLTQLVRQSSTFYDIILNQLNDLAVKYPEIDFDYIQNIITEALPNAIGYFQTAMTNAVPMLYNAGLSIINWIVNIILAFVISCYLMSDRNALLHNIKKILYAIFDQTVAYKIIVTVKECNQLFSQFIIGKFIDSLIIGILCFILMSFLNLPYAVLISLVVGITNMIPYFGPFIGAIPGTIILLIISPKQALIFVLLILALQQFDGAILGPRILGESVGLRPIWIIFAITVGGALGGVLGMFLGVPIVAVIIYLLGNLCDYFLYKRKVLPDLSNIIIPDINHNNVLIPKGAAQSFRKASKKNRDKEKEKQKEINAEKPQQGEAVTEKQPQNQAETEK